MLGSSGKNGKDGDHSDRKAESRVAEKDLYLSTGQRGKILEVFQSFDLKAAGEIHVTLTPVKGKAIICSAVVKPAPPKGRESPFPKIPDGIDLPW